MTTMQPSERLVLASGSPRRRELLQAAGYVFDVVPADPSVECGVCSGESPAELVARYAFRKAQDVAAGVGDAMVLAADTVASCRGQILGKPDDRTRAGEMLRILRGTSHQVLTGVCLWQTKDRRAVVDVSVTELEMQPIDDSAIESYLDVDLWIGKAGGFGYQDGNDWLRVIKGSESNVIGLPMERLAELMSRFDDLASPIKT